MDPLSYPSNIHTRPPPLTNFRGGGFRTPAPPLWIRAWVNNSCRSIYSKVVRKKKFPNDQKFNTVPFNGKKKKKNKHIMFIYNGAVCRNHRIKRVVPCRCLDWHVKEPYEMSMAWEPDRWSNFFFSPLAHLCAVTYMTEISLIVTLNNQFN